MNKLTIPPPPNWYGDNIIACASDNTLVYASKTSLAVIHPSPLNEPSDVKVMARCHTERIFCVLVNPNWGDPDKLVVSLGEDNIVSLWDIKTYKLKLSHSGHTTRSDRLIGATFAGNDKVVSISEEGFIIIWRLGANHLNSLGEMTTHKIRVSCISSCPHAPWLTAIGLKRGDILIADLRKTGRVLYKFKAHDSTVLSLSWCPTPFNIFPKVRVKIAKQVQKEATNTESLIYKTETEDISTTDTTEIVSCKDGTKTEIINSDPAQCETPTDVSTSKQETETAIINAVDTIEIVGGDAQLDVEDTNSMHKQSNVTPIESDSNLENGQNRAEENAASPFGESQVDIKRHDNDEVKEASLESNEVVNNSSGNTNEEPQQSIQNQAPLDEPNIVVESSPQENNVVQNQGLLNVSTEVVENSSGNINQEPQQSIQNQAPLDESNEVVEKSSYNIHQEPEQSVQDRDDNICSNLAADEDCKENQTVLENGNKDQELPESQTEMEDEDAEIVLQNKEYLLASSARGGKSIMIWRSGTDGVKQTELYIPSNKSHGKARFDDKSWITICWITPKSLLSSSHKGELILWNLRSPANCNKWRVIHGDHKQQLFSIAAPRRLYYSVDEEDWRGRNTLNAWTVGKDRFILNTSLCAERKTLASYPTILGSVFSVMSSPTIPSRIAIATSDGGCRFWDLTRPHLQHIVMSQSNNKVQVKTTNLAWHPIQDTILAYGSIDGRIGITDPCNLSKPTSFLIQHMNANVHKLAWGPLNGDTENLGLYVVLGSKLIVYDLNNRLQAPIELDICEKEHVAQMAWKPDYSICAVTTKASTIRLFNTALQPLTNFYIQDKSAYCLEWHPHATEEDEEVSPYANWLAVATHNITVYDCSSSEQDYSERVVAVFTRHTKQILGLSWSTFEGGKLASASEQGVVHVWDVKTTTLLHSCATPHLEHLSSVLWSPRDRDYIITGSKEGTIQVWKLSENPPQEKVKKLKLPKIQGGAEISNKSNNDNQEIVEQIEKQKPPLRKYLLAALADKQNWQGTSPLLQDCKRLFELHYGNGSQKESVVDQSKEVDVLQIFGNDTDLTHLLNLEKEYHSLKRVLCCAEQISLWQGDIESSIREAIRAKTLTPWLINMSPMVSHSLYREACEVYAKQLSERISSCPFEISSYYLACHKLDEALEILCEHKKFREALALAKCRLVASDPLITKIIERWAAHSTKTGSFEVACQCYIVLHRLEDAAKTLFKRSDFKTLKFCAQLAEHCGDKNFEDAVLFRLKNIEDSEEEEAEIPLPSRLEVVEMEYNLNNQNGDCKLVPEEINDQAAVLQQIYKVSLGDGQLVLPTDVEGNGMDKK